MDSDAIVTAANAAESLPSRNLPGALLRRA